MINLSNWHFGQIVNTLSTSISTLESQRKYGIGQLEHSCKNQAESGKPIEMCMACVQDKFIHDLKDIHSKLLPYQKNTVFNKTYVSLTAFEQACDKLNIPCTIEDVLNKTNDVILHRVIKITLKHFALDPSGYSKGNEYVTFYVRAIKRSESGLIGIGYFVDNWIICPDDFEIDNKNLFPSEQLTADMHDDNCPNRETDNFDDCNCAEYADLYMASDEGGDDFWFDQLDYELSQIMNHLPEAEFQYESGEDRIWSIGDVECYNMDELDRDVDNSYLNELNFTNGFEPNESKWK